jgi:hypothetical protein
VASATGHPFDAAYLEKLISEADAASARALALARTLKPKATR